MKMRNISSSAQQAWMTEDGNAIVRRVKGAYEIVRIGYSGTQRARTKGEAFALAELAADMSDRQLATHLRALHRKARGLKKMG